MPISYQVTVALKYPASDFPFESVHDTPLRFSETGRYAGVGDESPLDLVEEVPESKLLSAVLRISTSPIPLIHSKKDQLLVGVRDGELYAWRRVYGNGARGEWCIGKLTQHQVQNESDNFEYAGPLVFTTSLAVHAGPLVFTTSLAVHAGPVIQTTASAAGIDDV